jgi:two-component system sensor histidine kinase UhpB
MLPAWFILAVLVVSVPTIMGLLLYFVWQYSDLLRETLAQAQRANTALASSQRQLAEHVRELQASRMRIVRVQEGVRREIAAHLHGRVQGRLLVLRGRLLELQANAGLPAELPPYLNEVADSLALIVEEDLSTLSRRLYPSILRRGLVPALESLADHFDAAVAVAVQIDPALRCAEQTRCDVLPEPTRLAAYRIMEEALTNVVKHAGATAVRLCLDWSTDGLLRLAVADDGIGFDVAAAGDGLGMAAIHDHAAAVGGAISVRSAPGTGAEVVVTLPLPAREPAPPPRAGSWE